MIYIHTVPKYTEKNPGKVKYAIKYRKSNEGGIFDLYGVIIETYLPSGGSKFDIHSGLIKDIVPETPFSHYKGKGLLSRDTAILSAFTLIKNKFNLDTYGQLYTNNKSDWKVFTRPKEEKRIDDIVPSPEHQLVLKRFDS